MAVSVTAVLKVVIIESMSVSSLLMMVRGENLLPIMARKVSNTFGSFSFPRSNLSLVCFGLLKYTRLKFISLLFFNTDCQSLFNSKHLSLCCTNSAGPQEWRTKPGDI